VKDDQTKLISAVALTGRDPIAVTAGSLPNTIHLFKWGENKSVKGSFFVNDTTLAAVQQQIDSGVFNRVVVDFDHQSSKQSPNYKPAPRHHAAYGDVAITADHSIVLQNVAYTPTGQEFAPDFYDVSPVPIHTKDGVVLGIQSAALVTQGALLESTLFSAEFDGGNQQEKNMTEEQLALFEQMKTELAAVRTELDALNASESTPLTAGALEPVQVLADAATASIVEHKTLLDSQKVTLVDQGQQITVLSAMLTAQRKETMLQLAAVQGKAVTLTEQAVTDLSVEDLAAHITTLGVTLPILRNTPTGDGTETTTTNLAADQNALIAQLKRDTGETNWPRLWDMAKAAKPELFA